MVGNNPGAAQAGSYHSQHCLQQCHPFPFSLSPKSHSHWAPTSLDVFALSFQDTDSGFNKRRFQNPCNAEIGMRPHNPILTGWWI